jgi:hypothetical protein
MIVRAGYLLWRSTRIPDERRQNTPATATIKQPEADGFLAIVAVSRYISLNPLKGTSSPAINGCSDGGQCKPRPETG